MFIRSFALCFGLLCALHTQTAFADIILEYDAAASTSNPTLTAVNVNPVVTADVMAAGAGITAHVGSTWHWRDYNPANTSFADAVADGEAWTWGFDVTQNFKVDLTTLNIRLNRSNVGPDDFEIQASINGGAATSILTHDFAGTHSAVNFLNVDLSSLGPLFNGDSIVFTLGAFNTVTDVGTFELAHIPSETYALQLNGTVSAVPEPAAMGLILGIGGIVVVRRRMRKRKVAA